MLDQKAIDSNKAVLSLYICNYSFGWKTLISSKIPIQQENGEIVGVYEQVLDISNTNLFKWCLALNKFDQRLIDSTNKPAIYVLNQEHSPIELTKRQQECVFLLMRGKSMKEIAEILNLSVHTIESYFVTIKLKLGCSNKSQIYRKSYQYWFFILYPRRYNEK
ncbi:MAG: helix-turn-helix transcriptional regulator [Candidatus Rickettsia vulgarisii]